MNQLENLNSIKIPKEQLWENLKISNDFMFAKVMRNMELCKGILERLLEIKIDYIEYPEEQKVIDITKDSKSVRLDVYLEDEKGTVYNVEIQTTNNKNLPKRSRYYQAMIDLNAIEKGADYDELPQSFVIFICTFDVFGKGLCRYTFRNMCKEDSKLYLKDETTKIFFNTEGTKGDISEDAKKILNYIGYNAAEDDFTEKLSKEVQRIKENKEWEVEYMTLLMREREKYKEGYAEGKEEGKAEGKAEGREEGKAEGRAEGRAKGIIDTLLELGYNNEDILSALQRKLDISVTNAEEYLKKFYEGTL